MKLPEAAMALLDDELALKVLATADSRGAPHAVVKKSLRSDDDGNVIYLELIETSQTNSTMTSSLWFGRAVSVLLASPDGRSWRIKGRPYRCLVAGPIFERYYREARECFEDAELAAVWVITPEDARDESLGSRAARESSEHPLMLHLDRIAKEYQSIKTLGSAKPAKELGFGQGPKSIYHNHAILIKFTLKYRIYKNCFIA
jgi:hypothetical protein